MKRPRKKISRKLLFGVLLTLGLCLFVLLFAKDASAPSSQDQTGQPNSSLPTASSFNKQAHSLTEAGSIWWVVSKVRPLSPLTYAPTDLVVPNVTLRYSKGNHEMRLRQETASALEALIAAAKSAGVDLMLASGYRSYQLQVSVYNGYVQRYGQAGADKVSARPGTSEHQTGLAADLGSTNRKCELETCFADTPEGMWLAAHAHEFGFIIRYPEGKYDVTGYEYEPWHFRYVGKDLAAEMNNRGIQTLEEFFHIIPDKQPY